MKERPILFSGEMVKAILDGRKTMTRRVVKFPYAPKMLGAAYNLDHQSAFPASEGGWIFYTCPAEFVTKRMQGGKGLPCPYGQPGDRLWVRETWMPFTEQGCPIGATIYKATDHPVPDENERGPFPLKWKSPIFMPLSASRITLEITAVRVERVRDISGRDIEAEGFAIRYTIPGAFAGLDEFRALWDSLNAKRGYGWDANPWAWVISFKRVT